MLRAAAKKKTQTDLKAFFAPKKVSSFEEEFVATLKSPASSVMLTPKVREPPRKPGESWSVLSFTWPYCDALKVVRAKRSQRNARERRQQTVELWKLISTQERTLRALLCLATVNGLLSLKITVILSHLTTPPAQLSWISSVRAFTVSEPIESTTRSLYLADNWFTALLISGHWMAPIVVGETTKSCGLVWESSFLLSLKSIVLIIWAKKESSRGSSPSLISLKC